MSDLALAGVVLVLNLSAQAAQGHSAAGYALVGPPALALLLRRERALAVLAVVAACDLIRAAATASTAANVATLVALYSVGRYLAPRVAWAAAGAAFPVYGAIALLTSLRRQGRTLGDVEAFDLVPTGAVALWPVFVVLLGQLVRLNLELRERRRAEVADAAVRAERRRIARELHDVVAHHITTMHALIGGARLTLARDPRLAESSLTDAERAGREALAEMRHLLRLLRADDITVSSAPARAAAGPGTAAAGSPGAGPAEAGTAVRPEAGSDGSTADAGRAGGGTGAAGTAGDGRGAPGLGGPGPRSGGAGTGAGGPGAGDGAGGPGSGDGAGGPGSGDGAARAESGHWGLGGRGVAELGELVERARGMGLAARLETRGEPVALPRAVDHTVYRIVQEALTNTRKYAGTGARVAVRVGHEPGAVEVEVVDEGPAEDRAQARARGRRDASAAVPGGPPGGFGLVGMAERVAMCGGDLRSGARPEGGFRVWARLPVSRETA
ncbi:sensor histidine kinase [Bailinhaonella thermotolerans]|uniref:sensor histidine kinase n=1 Tax=Bailinhaonella thermotolerans TaxID=1070861 RepID=UPI0011C37168|nr:histidine kinase [Bailinhaonella thermotolerans]